MQDLLNIKNELIGGVSVQAVSANELYRGLGLTESQYKRWAVRNVLKNDCFLENKDWSATIPMSKANGGCPLSDYVISIDFAVSLVGFAKTISSKVKMDILTALGASDKVCITSRAEIEFLDMLEKVIEPMGFTMNRQVSIPSKKGTNYRIDAVINELKIAIEYDEEHHKHTTMDDENRQSEIEESSDYWFIRLDSSESHLFNIGLVMKTIVLYSEISNENLYL